MAKKPHYLLDTHVLLWAALDSRRLSSSIRRLLTEDNVVFGVSAATAWEIATKVRIGKMPHAIPLESDYERIVNDAGYVQIPISTTVALRAGRLTGTHKDPFDRMIAAQALALDIPLLSEDAALDAFGVHRIW